MTGSAGTAVIKNGTGVLTFNVKDKDAPTLGNSTFTGDVIINGGTVRYGVASALPTTADVIFNTASGTATLDLNNLNGTIASLTLGGESTTVAAVTTGTGILTLDGNVSYIATNNPNGATIDGLLDLGAATRTFTIGNSSAAAIDLRVNAPTSGAGGLIKEGAGTLSLPSALNAHTGGVTLNAGVLRASAGSTTPGQSGLGTGALTLAGGELILSAGTATSPNNNTTVTANATITGDRNASGAGLVYTLGTLSIGTQTLTMQPGTNITSGTSQITFGNTALTGNATFNVSNSGPASGRLNLGAIGGGAFGLTKDGNGILRLNGTNTYTGTTTVSNGTLLVNGSLGDTAVTVASGATLGGSGTVGTSAVLNMLTVNGMLAPGTSPGTLTITDNLDLNGSLSMELNGTTAGTGHDQVVVNGAVDITGSNLTASFNTFTPVEGDLLFIAVNDGADAIAGTFTGLSQNAIVANYGGFDWKISYNANSSGGTFTGGNDIALMAVTEPVPLILSSWTFDSGASPNARLASSATSSGLTVSQLNFHPTFDAVPALVNNEEITLNALSIHDRWAADSGIGIIRVRRADYPEVGVPIPSGRSATFNSTNTSISGAAGTLGAPIWFSVSTDSLTNATIRKISITNPGGGTAPTYYFGKAGDPLGTGVADVQPTISLSVPITLAANETVYFSINMDSTAVASNHNINQVNLLGNTVALPPPPPPIGLVTGTLTVGTPHGTYNRLSVTVDPDFLGASSDTSDLTGAMDLTVNIDPDTGKTGLLTLSNGRLNGTNMTFSAFGYNIGATGLSAAVNTLTPPGTVNPDTGVFAASQHEFEIDQGTFAGTAAGQPFSESLAANPFSGLGTGNGSLTLTPAGTSGPYRLFNAVVILPVAINESILSSGVTTVITGTGTVKATGQIQMPSSEFNAWMIGQGATSFDPNADTAGNGAPDAIKWALGLALYDNPLPFLLKPVPSAPGTFTISLPPGGTVAPLTVESSTNLMPPWTPVPAGEMVPSVNPIPVDSMGEIQVTPTAVDQLFLRLRANP